MKKKFLLSAIVVIVALSMTAVLTSAQWEKVTPADDNILTMGSITAAGWSPDPLIQCTNMKPGEVREFKIWFMPNGTINQDVYIGLKDQAGDPSYDFAHSGKVFTAWDVGQDGSFEYGWADILDLFSNFRLLQTNSVPGVWIPVTVKIKLDISAGNDMMGASADFYVLIYAVQAGGSAPTGVPDLYTLP